MVALVTLLNGVEHYFGWRARWVLMDETQYRLNRLRDEMDYYIRTTPTADLSKDQLDQFFHVEQDIWADVNRRGIEFHRMNQSSPTGELPPGAGTT